MFFPVFAAYTLDEVDEKTKAFRAYANYTVGGNASARDVSMEYIYILNFIG